MRCPYCGIVVSDDAPYCPVCGVHLEAAGGEAAAPAHEHVPDPSQVPSIDEDIEKTQVVSSEPDTADDAPEPVEAEEVDGVVLPPDEAREAELADLPEVDETDAVPEPVAEDDPEDEAPLPELADLPEVDETDVAPETVAEDDSEDEAPLPVAEPLPSIHAVMPVETDDILPIGATPLRPVPVSRHEENFRSSVDHRHHVSRRQEDLDLDSIRSAVTARFQPKPKTEAAEEAAADQAQAEAEEAVESATPAAPVLKALQDHSKAAAIGGIVVGLVAIVVGVAIVVSNGRGTPAPAEPEHSAAEQASEAPAEKEEAPSPITAEGGVSYNSQSGALTIEGEGFSTVLPAGMDAQALSDGTGLKLYDKPSGATIEAWVRPNSGNGTVESLSDKAEAAHHLTRSYVSTLENWFTVASWEGDTAYYVREYVRGSKIFAVELSWPKAKQDDGNTIVDAMNKSVKMADAQN